MNALLNEIAAELNTTDKNLVISVAIKSLVAEGVAVRKAFELVLGAGAWDRMANAIYAGFQK